METKPKSELLISYLNLRRFLGILGIVFPLLLIFVGTVFGKCDAIQDSISAYFHTHMRDVFVAVISSLAFFLFTYKGYDRKDNILCNVAGVAALLIAFCPTSVNPVTECMSQAALHHPPIIGKIHLGAAAVFFVLIMYISIFQFTKGGDTVSDAKKTRNLIYIACGGIMFMALLGIALYFLYLEKEFPFLVKYKPVFWLETIALFAFGISWLVKGETFFKDTA